MLRASNLNYEMGDKRRAHYSWEQLKALRELPAQEIRRKLEVKLASDKSSVAAERRLWIRELMDREDSEQLSTTIEAIKGADLTTLKLTIKSILDRNRCSSQGRHIRSLSVQ